MAEILGLDLDFLIDFRLEILLGILFLDNQKLFCVVSQLVEVLLVFLDNRFALHDLYLPSEDVDLFIFFFELLAEVVDHGFVDPMEFEQFFDLLEHL